MMLQQLHMCNNYKKLYMLIAWHRQLTDRWTASELNGELRAQRKAPSKQASEWGNNRKSLTAADRFAWSVFIFAHLSTTTPKPGSHSCHHHCHQCFCSLPFSCVSKSWVSAGKNGKELQIIIKNMLYLQLLLLFTSALPHAVGHCLSAVCFAA